MDKLRHWAALEKTDPKHTKPFSRPGGFKGTAIRPIWNQYRLTEHFGPVGLGWGTEEPKFTTMEANGEVLVYCTVMCWYVDETDKRAELYGIGGDKILVKTKDGLRADDEAYKKAFTDALGNAFQRLGVSADVHMGLFENSKYVQEMRGEFTGETAEPARARSRAAPSAQPASSATSDPRRGPSEEYIAAYKALIHDIDEAGKHSLEAVRLVYDDVANKWNTPFQKEAKIVAEASVDGIKALKDRVAYWVKKHDDAVVVTEADASKILADVGHNER